MLATAIVAALTAWTPNALLDRRAVLGGAASAALLAVPSAAMAKSKERAAEKAVQKATAAEARQAMKEYKYAPRPELVGDAKTGYTYKADTLQAGSQGELASYFKDKGSKIQGEYKADKARAMGTSAADAAKLAADFEAKEKAERQAAYMAKRQQKSQDQVEIEKFCKTEAGKTAKDVVGRSLC